MRILKVGVPPDEKKYEAECRHCHSVIEFSRKEAAYIVERQLLEITCPKCGQNIHVKP